MLMLYNTSAKEPIETKGSQGNSERRTFVKKPDTQKSLLELPWPTAGS